MTSPISILDRIQDLIGERIPIFGSQLCFIDIQVFFEPAFDRAVDDVTAVARRLVDSLQTPAPPRNREEVAARARERAAARFG